MKDLKEKLFGSDDVILKNNSVNSSILPQGTKELSRNIKIQGDAVIEGSVYGNNILVEGGEVVFKGAVFANNELHISNDIKDRIIFEKAIASSNSVAVMSISSKVIFYSDINAKQVKLKNCYVGGSIFAQEVYLENCIVLGGVFGTKQSVISHSIVGTFHSPFVELSDKNYLLYPACFSVEPISYLPNAELFNISLADLGSLFKGDKEKDNTGKIKIDLENDKQKTVLVGDDETTNVLNSYSVSGRVLAADLIDFDKFENHFLLEAGALGTQILKTYSLNKEDGSKSIDLTVINIAEFFFKILNESIAIKDLSGNISFEEIKKNFA